MKAVLCGVAAALVAALVAAAAGPHAASAPAAAPLDPLVAEEIMATYRAIERDARFPRGALFTLVQLKEPPKSEVLAWMPGQPFRREAFAQVFDRGANRLYEVTVDLRRARVLSWTERPGVQPGVAATEFADCDRIVRADPRWAAAMRARGIDPGDVYLDIWAPGDPQNAAEETGTRLLRAISYYRGPLPNPYDRPIEGVVVTMDMNAMRVSQFVDTGVKPVNTTLSGSAERQRPALKPLLVRSPGGPSFDLAGHAVTWQGWHFRIGFSTREGMLLYQVGYEDGGTVRPIIYKLSMDEVYVPYGVPDANWAWRTAFDVGEYNLGQYAFALEQNRDVPDNSVFLDETYPSDTGTDGGTYELRHAVAIYEQNGGPLWTRVDPSSFEVDGRLARELVVTSSYWIGNYIYGVSYVFGQDGSLDLRVDLTGTTVNRGIARGEGSAFETTVDPILTAPNHQHFFNFRIDFDVDGTNNDVVELNTQNVPSPFGNAFAATETTLGSERARDLQPSTFRTWGIESGRHTGYVLRPGAPTLPFSAPDFPPLLRASFAQQPFWVTRYKDGESYAAGDYPNQGRAGEGLASYTAAPESTRASDVVVWYTVGTTHHPEVEEFPVMSATTIGFGISPSGFFARNPALDVPPQK